VPARNRLEPPALEGSAKLGDTHSNFAGAGGGQKKFGENAQAKRRSVSPCLAFSLIPLASNSHTFGDEARRFRGARAPPGACGRQHLAAGQLLSSGTMILR
jgi:hypothetical protein